MNIKDGNPPVTQTSYTKELHLQHVQAFWEGNLEWNSFEKGWRPAELPPGPGSDPRSYRIKQPQKLRPWNTTEIPLGSQIRAKGFHDISLIIGVQRGLVIWNDGVARISSPTTLFHNFEHSTNQGKTWLPCGVEE